MTHTDPPALWPDLFPDTSATVTPSNGAAGDGSAAPRGPLSTAAFLADMIAAENRSAALFRQVNSEIAKAHKHTARQLARALARLRKETPTR